MNSEWLKNNRIKYNRLQHRAEVANKENELQKIEHERKEELRLERMRDEFAMAALQGIIACFKDHYGANTVSKRAIKAYEYADAMMEARKK